MGAYPVFELFAPVALFPRRDPYEILRLMATNGWNYDIGPDSIVQFYGQDPARRSPPPPPSPPSPPSSAP